MGVMSNLGEIEIDTVQVQESIVQNMSAEEKAKLSHLESVMNNIQTEFQSREFNNYTIKKAQAIYACAFYDAEKSDNDFISKLADCFENANDDYELLALLNSTFGTDISQDDFNNLVSIIKNTVIDIDFSSTDKNNLDLVKWAEYAYEINGDMFTARTVRCLQNRDLKVLKIHSAVM
ncbi:MAG: hypothetical protein LIO62_06930 [Clostridiales bacterium]|nr:hypothetical protein [Clostridiales bacterium]